MKRKINQKVLVVEQELLQYLKRKITNERGSLPCPLKLQKPRPYFTNMRMLQLIPQPQLMMITYKL